MRDNSKRTGPAIEAHYQFLAWLVPTIEKFPKSHKFTIGDRIETIALDVLEALIEATYPKERTATFLGRLPATDRGRACGLECFAFISVDCHCNVGVGVVLTAVAKSLKCDATRPKYPTSLV
jgi:hypothetical protein